MSMYERPKRPRAVTAADVERAAIREVLLDAIENDPEIRTVLLRIIAASRPRRPRPTITQPLRQPKRGGR